jgi:hypothetical protein
VLDLIYFLLIGLADGLAADGIGRAKSFRQKLLALNPNLVLIGERRLYFMSGPGGTLEFFRTLAGDCYGTN